MIPVFLPNYPTSLINLEPFFTRYLSHSGVRIILDFNVVHKLNLQIVNCYKLAVTFLEYWKRKSASLSYHWDVMSFEEEEKSRPEFAARAPYIKRNPITGIQEPSFPTRLRYQRMAAGLVLIVLMVITFW